MLTSAAHAVPLPDAFSHLLRHVYAVAMEPLITVITATGNRRQTCAQGGQEIRHL